MNRNNLIIFSLFTTITLAVVIVSINPGGFNSVLFGSTPEKCNYADLDTFVPGSYTLISDSQHLGFDNAIDIAKKYANNAASGTIALSTATKSQNITISFKLLLTDYNPSYQSIRAEITLRNPDGSSVMKFIISNRCYISAGSASVPITDLNDIIDICVISNQTGTTVFESGKFAYSSCSVLINSIKMVVCDGILTFGDLCAIER